MMLLAAVFVFFLVPETKGIPLEKMDRLFEPNLPARRAHKVVMAEAQADDREFRRHSASEPIGKDQDTYSEKRIESA